MYIPSTCPFMLWVVCFDELDEDPYFPYNPSTFLSVLLFYISTFICINLWKWFGMFGIQRFHGDMTPKLSLYNSATHFSFDNKICEFKEHILIRLVETWTQKTEWVRSVRLTHANRAQPGSTCLLLSQSPWSTAPERRYRGGGGGF